MSTLEFTPASTLVPEAKKTTEFEKSVESIFPMLIIIIALGF